MRKKDQINLESKIKTVRFIGKKFVIFKLTSAYYGQQELSVSFYRKIFQYTNMITFSVSNEYSILNEKKCDLQQYFFEMPHTQK